MRATSLVRRVAVGAATASLVATGIGTFVPASTTAVDCRAYTIIGARGTDDGARESLGDRLPTAVAAFAAAKGPDRVTTDHVTYPASFLYPLSMAAGRKDLRAKLDAYLTSCPSTRIVLFGYSQGAQVVGDVVAGLPAATRARVHGVGLIGDPLYNPALAGSTSANPSWLGGMWGRRASWPADVFLVDVCNTGDPVCASPSLLTSLGGLGRPEHQDYVTAAWSPVHGASSAYTIGLRVAQGTS